MSAFVVSKDHIDAILSFAERRRMRASLAHVGSNGKEDLSWTDLGRILLAENERSVCHRYPDAVPGDAPGSCIEAIDYKFRTFDKFFHMLHTDVCLWTIKACDCYDYQACETEDYRESIAYQIVHRIRREAIRSLPGYDAAPWEIKR